MYPQCPGNLGAHSLELFINLCFLIYFLEDLYMLAFISSSCLYPKIRLYKLPENRNWFLSSFVSRLCMQALV